jgi:hypothetical protein
LSEIGCSQKEEKGQGAGSRGKEFKDKSFVSEFSSIGVTHLEINIFTFEDK